ncbi:MAG: hypothetical protein ACYCO3_04025, partial [Mycobacteriales bacterium]
MIRHRCLVSVVAIGAAAPLLAGCAAGLDASTSHEHASVQGGGTALSRPLQLEDVYVEPVAAAWLSNPGAAPHPRPTYTREHDGFVVAVVANNGGSALTVTGVSVSVGGTVTPSGAGNLTVPAGGTLSFVDPLTGQHGRTL